MSKYICTKSNNSNFACPCEKCAKQFIKNADKFWKALEIVNEINPEIFKNGFTGKFDDVIPYKTAQEEKIDYQEKEHYIHKCIELREREIKPINAGKDDLFCLYCGQPYYEK